MVQGYRTMGWAFVISALSIGSIYFLLTRSSEVDLETFYSFDLEVSANLERLHLSYVVRCQRYSLSTGTPGKQELRYAVRAKSLGRKLSNGQGLFVAVPDVCSYLQGPDGRYLNGDRLRGQWPPLQAPRSIVPLVYVADSFDSPQTISMFANPRGSAGVSDIEIVRSTVRQVSDSGATNARANDATDRDPFDPARNRNARWTGLAFLPTFMPVTLEEKWIAESIYDGECRFSLLNLTGHAATASIDPYAEYLGQFWPKLWQSVAPSEVRTVRDLTETQLANIEQGLALAIPTTYEKQGIRVVDTHARGLIKLYPEAEFIKGMHGFSQYYFGQKRFSTQPSDIELERGPLPIVAQCGDRLYRPVVLNFALETLD